MNTDASLASSPVLFLTVVVLLSAEPSDRGRLVPISENDLNGL